MEVCVFLILWLIFYKLFELLYRIWINYYFWEDVSIIVLKKYCLKWVVIMIKWLLCFILYWGKYLLIVYVVNIEFMKF